MQPWTRCLPFAVVALALTACGGPSPATPPSSRSDGGQTSAPRKIRAAIQGEPRTLSRTMNGNVGRVRGVNELEQLIHSGMSIENDEGDRLPQLTEAVPSIENGLWRVSPDGRMETTWKIRQGTTWH